MLGWEIFINPSGLSPPTLWARRQAGAGSRRAPCANLPWPHPPGLLLPWPRSEYPDRRPGHAPQQLMLRQLSPCPGSTKPEQGQSCCAAVTGLLGGPDRRACELFCECKHRANVIYTGLSWQWQPINNKRGEIKRALTRNCTAKGRWVYKED